MEWSTGTVALALVCVYLFGIKLLRLYAMETGNLRQRQRPLVQVVVLGDIGRSPRMRCHAVSLAEAGCRVDLIGHVETHPSSRITTHRSIRLRPLHRPPSVPPHLPRLVYVLWSPFRALWMALELLWVMGWWTSSPDYILVQNPPAIPTLAIAQWIATLRGARLVVDWHNLGHSVLSMALGQHSTLVKWAERYEQHYGRHAYAHLTVTDRMKKELVSWGASGSLVTFKDTPPYHFKRLSLRETHDFLLGFRLQDLLEQPGQSAQTMAEFIGGGDSLTQTTKTLITVHHGSEYSERTDRPFVIVSSTSWTQDEDFGLLLEAVALYEARATPTSPRLLFVITGKGPLKTMYEEKIARMVLVKTRIVTAWLASHEYPMLLGCADLGISLHTSSSGMDLPMKVVDMFGCGLPVCAVDFECLSELVTHGRNGFVFSTSEQLAQQITTVFTDPTHPLLAMRETIVADYAVLRWERQWRCHVQDLFLHSEQ
ncbi:hypothetical protein BDF14DRAFT_1862114 [Spinellus fusiger]|nr:hypothetical protein BDF14DRAFT_1862114 [Spinellus fusiger]